MGISGLIRICFAQDVLSPWNAAQNQRGPRGAGRTRDGRVSRPDHGQAGQHGVHGHAGQEGRPGRRRRRDVRCGRGRAGQADAGVPASTVRRRQNRVGRRRWIGGGLQARHGLHGHARQEGVLQGLGGRRVLRHARQEGAVRGRVLRRPRQEVAGPAAVAVPGRLGRRKGRARAAQDHRQLEVGSR